MEFCNFLRCFARCIPSTFYEQHISLLLSVCNHGQHRIRSSFDRLSRNLVMYFSKKHNENCCSKKKKRSGHHFNSRQKPSMIKLGPKKTQGLFYHTVRMPRSIETEGSIFISSFIRFL